MYQMNTVRFGTSAKQVLTSRLRHKQCRDAPRVSDHSLGPELGGTRGSGSGSDSPDPRSQTSVSLSLQPRNMGTRRAMFGQSGE